MSAYTNLNNLNKSYNLTERQEIVESIDAKKLKSNLPIYALCRERGIELYQYYTWRRKVIKQRAPEITKAPEAPVTVPQVLIVVVSGSDVDLNGLVDQARRLNLHQK